MRIKDYCPQYAHKTTAVCTHWKYISVDPMVSLLASWERLVVGSTQRVRSAQLGSHTIHGSTDENDAKK